MYSTIIMKHICTLFLIFSLKLCYSQTPVRFPGQSGVFVYTDSLVNNPIISIDSVYTVKFSFLQVKTKSNGYSQTIKNNGPSLNQQSISLIKTTKPFDTIILSVHTNTVNGKSMGWKNSYIVK